MSYHFYPRARAHTLSPQREQRLPLAHKTARHRVFLNCIVSLNTFNHPPHSTFGNNVVISNKNKTWSVASNSCFFPLFSGHLHTVNYCWRSLSLCLSTCSLLCSLSLKSKSNRPFSIHLHHNLSWESLLFCCRVNDLNRYFLRSEFLSKQQIVNVSLRTYVFLMLCTCYPMQKSDNFLYHFRSAFLRPFFCFLNVF